MTIYKKDLIDHFDKQFERLLSKSVEHNKFLSALSSNDDWTFIIKSHALIETVVTQLLITISGDDNYSKLYQRMSISQKIELSRDLNLCTNQEYKFLKYYSQLRNKIVHKVEYLDFNFESYIKSLNKSEFKKFIDAMEIDDQKSNSSCKDFNELLITKTKYALWLLILPLTIIFYSKGELTKGMKEVNEKALETSENILREYLPEIFADYKNKTK